MGVYIKGMKMPQTCIDCPLYRYTAVNHYCCVAPIRGQKATERDKDCPLVEVREKARSIDGRFTSGDLSSGWSYIKPLDGEIWLPIKGYEERYMVSNMGRVRNRVQLLSLQQKARYLTVILNNGDNKHRKSRNVHRLVAEAFVENPDPAIYRQVNHIDEDKHNNKASNLEWCTAKYNLYYGEKPPIGNLKHKRTVIEEEDE